MSDSAQLIPIQWWRAESDLSKALPLLAKREWYSRVKYGYARGWEPVLYVNNIRSYYNILRWITASEPQQEEETEPEETIELASTEISVSS